MMQEAPGGGCLEDGMRLIKSHFLSPLPRL